MKLPIIIMLALMPLVLTAYAEEAPSHVDVYDYPFNITLLEGGNFTLYNNGTANINMVSHGWFNAVAPAGESVTVDLPADRFFADTYYVQDVMNDSISTITIVKPQVNFNATSSETLGTFEPISNSTLAEPTAPKVELEELPCGIKEQGEVTTYDCKVTFYNGVARANVMVYNDDLTPYINYKTVGYFVNNGIQGESITIIIDRIEAHEYKQIVFMDKNSNGVSEFELTLGENIKPVQFTTVEETGGDPLLEETKSTSDTEVLNLRLEILKVIESIFRLVLQ